MKMPEWNDAARAVRFDAVDDHPATLASVIIMSSFA